ncbi:MAG: hypothetical protein IPI42_10595 [Saprospiraceae bacterium]|nr:hypothetical protein [Candidatus Parvibacillus calidus]
MSILILGLLALLGYSLFAKGYFNFQPEGRRYEKISLEVQDYLKAQQPGLVNFQEDELGLLSGNKQKSGKSGFLESKRKEFCYPSTMNLSSPIRQHHLVKIKKQG